MKYTKIVIIALASSILTSCYYDREEELYGVKECAETVSFKDDVSPVIMKSCATTGCHADVQSPIFTDYASISSKADRINFRIGNGTMPPNGPLSTEDIDKISCWITQGKLDN